MEIPNTRTAPAPRGTIVGLALSMMLASLGISIPYVALPVLTEVFEVPFQKVQWVIVAYLLSVTVLVAGVGRLADILGRERVLLAGIAIYTAASILCGVAPSFWALIAGRVFQGVGAAALMALSLALVRQSVSRERVGSAMGLLGTMSAVGTALGPTLGGFLLAGSGWQAIFLILVPCGIVNFLLIRRVFRSNGLATGGSAINFDTPGMVLLGLAVGAYAIGLTAGEDAFGAPNLLALAAAAAFGSIFLMVERRAKAPLIQMETLRDPRIGGGVVMNAIAAMVIMTVLVVSPPYLSGALGFGPACVGLIVSIGPIVSALSGVPAGRLVDRIGPPSTLAVGLGAMTLGLAGVAILPDVIGVAGYIGAVAILTPGYQLFLAANNTAVMSGAREDQRGAISGVLTLSRNLGLTTGASLMGVIFVFGTGAEDIAVAPDDSIAAGARTAFLVAAGCTLLATVFAVLGRARDATTERI